MELFWSERNFSAFLYAKIKGEIYVLDNDPMLPLASFARYPHGIQWRKTVWKYKKLNGNHYFDSSGTLYDMNRIGKIK